MKFLFLYFDNICAYVFPQIIYFTQFFIYGYVFLKRYYIDYDIITIICVV